MSNILPPQEVLSRIFVPDNFTLVQAEHYVHFHFQKNNSKIAIYDNEVDHLMREELKEDCPSWSSGPYGPRAAKLALPHIRQYQGMTLSPVIN